MWHDNETDRDFLNFSGVAETVAEIIVQANRRPVSIGVSGAWGVGKSSMIRLIRRSLDQRVSDKNRQFLFVEFNAWLYQGYDDARAALLDQIATTIAAEAKERETAVDKATNLLKRVNWFRAARMTVGTAASFAFGVPPAGLIGEVWDLAQKARSGDIDSSDIQAADQLADRIAESGRSLIKPASEVSPPKEIDAVRTLFEETLSELNVTLVVLIDDLDRCLPPTTIATLEAVRLFLFLKNTAFVVAADDTIIKHAVQKHFDGIDDNDLVTSYFDKLIQIPIRVPALGTQEVRGYLMMLFIENSELNEGEKETLRTAICDQLSKTWQGKRVDKAFVSKIATSLPAELITQLDTADRLAPLMTTASGITGNPRLIKRFLNALSIRMTISKAHGVGVDETVLAKMLLFERCASPATYSALTKSVNERPDGGSTTLEEWEAALAKGKELSVPAERDLAFVQDWLQLEPQLTGIDLRGVLYVSREHAPVITPKDGLSSDAADVLAALLANPGVARQLEQQVRALPRTELSPIMGRLLDQARKEQEWGTPAILDACIMMSNVDPEQGKQLATFLRARPVTQITAPLIAKIKNQPWAESLFEYWSTNSKKEPVKKAIERSR